MKGNMYNCNICESNNCPYGGKQFKKFFDTSRCKQFETPRKFYTPLLVQLLSDPKKSEAAYKLLNLFGFKFQERLEYPYFFLSVERG
jgi:hypothetical protein